MSSDDLNGTVEEEVISSELFGENDPELLAALEELDAIPSGDEETPSEENADSAQSTKTEEQKEVKKDGKLGLSDLKGKTWEELSTIKDKLPDEFMETFKSMERAVQMKMQAVAEEKKEAKRLQDEIEQLKRQMQEEPPYIKAERERIKQEKEAERLEAMDPDERREYELKRHNESLKRQIEELNRQIETEKFMAMKSEIIGDIRDELLSEGLSVKDKHIVYDLWTRHAAKDPNFTPADAVQLHKSEVSKPKTMTQADIDAEVEKRLKAKIDELKAKSKGATGIKGSTSASGKNLSDPKKEAKKISSAEDIFADLADLLPDD